MSIRNDADEAVVKTRQQFVNSILASQIKKGDTHTIKVTNRCLDTFIYGLLAKEANSTVQCLF